MTHFIENNSRSQRLTTTLSNKPWKNGSTAQIDDAIKFLYNKLFSDAVSEINSNLKPTFNHPYLWGFVPNALKVRGLYDTGADISCMSERIF